MSIVENLFTLNLRIIFGGERSILNRVWILLHMSQSDVNKLIAPTLNLFYIRHILRVGVIKSQTALNHNSILVATKSIPAS